MSTDKHWKVAIATVLTRLHWTEKAIRNMLGEIVEMLAAAEPAGPPACDCGWLTRVHSTECARYIWEHRNCLPGEMGYRAAEPAPLHASRTTSDADEDSP
ncbi:MAG: hypothetical protein IID41_00550 [Planctomycetes bacterium]|nr:hypothetical protein [Planctomycetota bacterium]